MGFGGLFYEVTRKMFEEIELLSRQIKKFESLSELNLRSASF